MTINQSKTGLQKEYRIACKHIRQANRGLSHLPSIRPDYKLRVDSIEATTLFTMQINYLDGDGQPQTYNIAL